MLGLSAATRRPFSAGGDGKVRTFTRPQVAIDNPFDAVGPSSDASQPDVHRRCSACGRTVYRRGNTVCTANWSIGGESHLPGNDQFFRPCGFLSRLARADLPEPVVGKSAGQTRSVASEDFEYVF